MKASELRQRSDEELNQELLALRREQFNLRMQKAVGQFARSDRFAAVRKEIARIKTIMKERKTAEGGS